LRWNFLTNIPIGVKIRRCSESNTKRKSFQIRISRGLTKTCDSINGINMCLELPTQEPLPKRVTVAREQLNTVDLPVSLVNSKNRPILRAADIVDLAARCLLVLDGTYWGMGDFCPTEKNQN
jgi:hypothetical protein